MDVWAHPQLGTLLRDAIESNKQDTRGDFSAAAKRSRFAPALAYGRHRGPARETSRVAAVAVALFWQDDQWMLPLTMRPTTLQHHGGQICLPGGQIEPGESPTKAALREYEEELGLKPSVDVHCGQLPMTYVYGSDNRVHAVVQTIQTPSGQWNPDPVEVAEVIQMPLRTWLTRESTIVSKSKTICQNGRQVGEFQFTAPALKYKEHVIWGATALILDELAQILHSLKT